MFAVVISTGCGIDKEHDLQVVISEVEGVLHVEIPSRAASEAPQWSLREIYNTSTDEPSLELFRVTAARFLDDGSLAIANSGSQELLQLDPRGAVRHRFGRAGSGPGEFSMMAALDIDRSGNLMVYDPRALRLTRVSPTGELVATDRLSPDDAVVDLHPLSELANGRIMIVFGAVREFGRNEETRDTVPLVIVDPSEGSWDTLAVWPAQEWANVAFPQGVSARAEVGFGRRLDPVPERATQHEMAGAGLVDAAPQRRSRYALPARAQLRTGCSGRSATRPAAEAGKYTLDLVDG